MGCLSKTLLKPQQSQNTMDKESDVYTKKPFSANIPMEALPLNHHVQPSVDSERPFYGHLLILRQWLGMLGPIIRAEVGDTVKVVFRNMASHNHTMHPHGFRYTKSSEGLSSAMQISDGNAVPPGQTWTYTWEVPGKAFPFFAVSILTRVCRTFWARPSRSTWACLDVPL